jgi:hypothetical protein
MEDATTTVLISLNFIIKNSIFEKFAIDVKGTLIISNASSSFHLTRQNNDRKIEISCNSVMYFI